MAKTQQPTSDDQLSVMELRDAPPTHFSFTIQSFSLLSKASIESYETNIFEAGGYKWKLCLYPSGNKSRNVKDHISLYLVIAETESLNPGRDVNIAFKFFLFDQVRDKYLTVEDTPRRFHVRKMEWGLDQFIALKTFNDASNGYLVDDVAVFGAEVFVSKESCRSKDERLLMIKGAVPSKHFWRLENFLKIENEFMESEVFMAGEHSWKVRLYPKGFGEGKGTHLSLCLVLADDPAKIPITRKVYADFTLRVKHIQDGRYIQNKVCRWFNASSSSKCWFKFVQLSYLIQQGFLTREICNVEAEVTVLGIVD